MTSFKTRISGISKTNGPIILANDYPPSATGVEKMTLRNIRTLHDHICAIKLNFHLLLRLGGDQIARITGAATDHGLVSIADIKLNDIGNTNMAAAEILWDLGFDAVIANPIMGPDSLGAVVRHAHKNGRGVIALCHMSAPEARLAYDLGLETSSPSRLYRLFLRWAIRQGADGIVAGATFPEVIRYCRRVVRGRMGIYSPGVGTQGGDPAKVVSAGADYLIVGRTITGSADPLAEARRIQDLAM